jgi:hypothetical protein
MSKRVEASEKINAVFYDILRYQLNSDGSWWTNDWTIEQTKAVAEAREAILNLINEEALNLINRLDGKAEKYRNEKGENRWVITQKSLLSEKRKYNKSDPLQSK